MGCATTKSQKSASVDKNRRRLSVGQDNGDGEEVSGNVEVTEEQRGMILNLDQQALVDLVQDGNGRKMSVGSATDDGKVSFAPKTLQKGGDHMDASVSGLGYTCRKGLKPDSPNQDSFIVFTTESCSIYVVFDGHGHKGHEVSNFVKENLPRLIVKDARFTQPDKRKELLKDVFKKIQGTISAADRMKKMKADLSGTTATVAIHDHQNSLITIAYVADSTAVVGKQANGKWEGEALTRDHKPNIKEEKKRIESAGGRVVFDGYANYRIYAKNARYPGLNMSRCLGDLLGHQDCGISAEPDLVEFEVKPDMKWLMLCSDGVWEFINAQEAVELVKDYGHAKATQGAERLAKEAWDRWIREEGGAVVDDITVVLVALNKDV